MIVLNRESIIEGLIEIRKEEDLENSIIVNNIKSIIDLNDISNLDKLKLITSKSVANTLTFVDNNTTGESVDPTFLLYVGGEDITATTLS